ncbi:MAG: hypothetical protein ACYTDU_05140 [Planctomycetota bacterium]
MQAAEQLEQLVEPCELVEAARQGAAQARIQSLDRVQRGVDPARAQALPTRLGRPAQPTEVGLRKREVPPRKDWFA